MAKSYKGKFKPKNPGKYLGDPTNIIYRSLWEFRFMRWCDSNSAVLRWSSEEVAIKYWSPMDRKYRRYFPDFVLEAINNEGKKEVIMIEIKPFHQTKEPVLKGTKKRQINEIKTWETNKAKWNAARVFCEQKGWKFQILTEKELGIK